MSRFHPTDRNAVLSGLPSGGLGTPSIDPTPSPPTPPATGPSQVGIASTAEFAGTGHHIDSHQIDGHPIDGHSAKPPPHPMPVPTPTDPIKLNPDVPGTPPSHGTPANPTPLPHHPGNSPGRSDEQLLADYRAGDSAAFTQLIHRYQRELYHFLVRFLGDKTAAEDVFQEAFLQIHQSADQFDPERRFKPWLFTIAANKARDLMRSNSRRPTSALQASVSPGDDDAGEFLSLISATQTGPEDELEREELKRKVQGVVMAMPANLREILLLSYYHQFPYRQIADILGIPLGTVKSRLHAAVAYFAAQWRRTNPHDGTS